MALRDILVRFGVQVDQSPLINTQKNVHRLVLQFRQLARIAAFAAGAIAVGSLVNSADRYIELSNRLKAVTNSTEEYLEAERGVVDIARKTYSSVEDTAELYQRYAQVTDHLSLSQGDLLNFTHRVTQAMKIGGATAAETRGALIQLSQGIGTNFKAGGQEIRSIQEQSVIMAGILAKAAGGTRGELMLLAKQGKLSGKKVVAAVLEAGDELDKLWAKRQRSFEDMRQALDTEWLMLIKQMMPAFKVILVVLEKLVIATREWVEKGEALNTFITIAIIAVGYLTVAFGGLAASVLAALAPFIAMYLVIEDFVTFLRGGDSIIGRFFDSFTPGGANVMRRAFQDAWVIAKDFFAWLSEPELVGRSVRMIYDLIVEWFGKGMDWVDERFKKTIITLATGFRGVFGNTVADVLGVLDTNDPMAIQDYLSGKTSGTDSKLAIDKFNLGSQLPKVPKGPTEFALPPELGGQAFSFPAAPLKAPGMGGATHVEDNRQDNRQVQVTVQGNADAETARKMAELPELSMKIDLSHIGDAVGVQ